MHIQGLLLVLCGSNWVQFVCLFGLYLIGGTRSTNSVTLVFDCFPKSWANKSIGFLDSRWWAITSHLSISEARNFPTNVLSLHPCAMVKLNWGVYPVDLHLWKKRNERLKSLCCAVENVDGAKNLIGFCLGRQSWAFLSDSAVHTTTSNRLHWLEIANLWLLFSNLWKSSLHYISPVSWLVDRLVGQCRH